MPKPHATPANHPLSPALIRLVDALAEVIVEECTSTMQEAERAASKSGRIACNSQPESEAAQTVLLSFEDVASRVGLGRTRIYAGMATGDFPAPIKAGRRSLWVQSEIDRWIAKRIAERDSK